MVETLIVQADMAGLARIGDWACEAAKRMDLPDSTLFALQLCFEEAVSNIILHGFEGATETAGSRRDVRVALTRKADALTATIEDHGIAFDPRTIARPVTPTSIEEAKIGGLGIHLIRQFTRGLAYRRDAGTNCLTLHFDLAPVAVSPT